MNLFHKTILSIWSLFYPLKIYGKENIPKNEGAVFVCNHFSALDCGFVARAYNKDIFFLAKKELFDNKLIGSIIKGFGGIPIDRGNPDIKSLFIATKVLKDNHKLAIFPEGTRNRTKTNQLQELKGGTVVFAIKAKCAIVPMMLDKKAKFLRRTNLIIGQPFYLDEFYGKKLTPELIDEITQIMRDKMLEQQEKLNEILDKKKKN